MRGWMLPLVLALLVLPSVVAVLSAGVAVFGDDPPTAGALAMDVLRAAVSIAVALVVLRIFDSRRGSTLALLDRRAVEGRRGGLAGFEQGRR